MNGSGWAPPMPHPRGHASAGGSAFPLDTSRAKRRRARMAEVPEETILNGHAIKRLCIEGEEQPEPPPGMHGTYHQQDSRQPPQQPFFPSQPPHGLAYGSQHMPPAHDHHQHQYREQQQQQHHPSPLSLDHMSYSQNSMEAYGAASPFSSPSPGSTSSRGSNCMGNGTPYAFHAAVSHPAQPSRAAMRHGAPPYVGRSISDSCLAEAHGQACCQPHTLDDHDVDYSLINNMLKRLHFEKRHRGDQMPPLPPPCPPRA